MKEYHDTAALAHIAERYAKFYHKPHTLLTDHSQVLHIYYYISIKYVCTNNKQLHRIFTP